MRSRSLALALLWSVAAGAATPLPQWPARIVWEPQFVGLELASVTLRVPRPLRIHALRIDLDAPGLSVITDRDNGERPLDVDGVKTSTFLVESKCQAAINGCVFGPPLSEEGGPQDIIGLSVSEGRVVSPVDDYKPRAALVIRNNRRAAIAIPPIDLQGVETAVGGYGVILNGGVVVRPAEEPEDIVNNRHPRTAAGIAGGGRTLILVVVDGRQEGYSEGVDLAELAEILRLLGAEDAINLDGGGSTTMVVEKPRSGFWLVNRLINDKVPGNERITASHLGVYARPLP